MNLTSFIWGARRESTMGLEWQHQSKLIKSTPGSRGRRAGFEVLSGRVADEDGIGGTKTRREKG